jgi:hypothetical protein
MADCQPAQHPENAMLKALLIALYLLVASPALAQSAGEIDQKIDDLLGPHAIYATAIQTLQKALADGDLRGVAGYVPFGEPIKVNGEDVVIDDEADLAAKFPELFNEKVVSAVTTQAYDTLFVNQDGIMFGDGELWLSGECFDDACTDVFINIVAINNK